MDNIFETHFLERNHNETQKITNPVYIRLLFV